MGPITTPGHDQQRIQQRIQKELTCQLKPGRCPPSILLPKSRQKPAPEKKGRLSVARERDDFVVSPLVVKIPISFHFDNPIRGVR